MKQFLALLIVLLALVAASFSAVNGATGIRAIVRKAGLNEVIKDVLPLVIQSAHDVKIDDITGSQKVPVVGEVEYKLTNIAITKVEINSFEVNMTAPNAVGVVVSGLTVGLGLKWSYLEKGWPHSSGNGDASATAAGSSARISVVVTVVNGKPVLKADVVSISLGNLDVKISGGTAGWILNLLEGLFKGTIKSAAEQGITAAITQSINVQANDQIQKANFVVPIPNVPLEFDATLSEDIVVTSEYLIAGDKAQMYNSQTHQEPPFAPVELPTTPVTSNTLEVHVADFVANAAGFAAFTSGILKVNVTPEEVPESSPIKLNTTDLKYMIPELYAKYPDMGIQLSIVALRAPLVKFAADGASGVVNGSITFFVFDKTTPLTHAFTMGVVMSAKLTNLGVISTETQFNITLQIADPSVDLSLISTSIGPVDVSTLQSTIKVVVIAGFLPQVNKKLKAGIPIDLPKGLVIQNPVVKLNSGFITVAGDITYTAPSSIRVAGTQASDKKEHIKNVVFRIHQLKEQLASLEDELQHLLFESFDIPEENTAKIHIN